MRWSGSQLLFLAPTLALVAILSVRSGPRQPAAAGGFARRYVTALALGPFLVTTALAALLGRLPIAMWGYPLWCFAPLAAVMWLGPARKEGSEFATPRSHNRTTSTPDPSPQGGGETERLRWFARAFVAVFLAWPLAYAAIELLEPLVRDRPKATQFPGRAMAEAITARWRERTGTPLAYVGGVERASPGAGEFAANNVAVYSGDRPHVIVHGEPRLSPWIDPADLERRGAVLVWEQGPGPPDLPDNVRALFSRAEVQPLLVLPRATLRPVRPAVIGYAFVPPQP